MRVGIRPEPCVDCRRLTWPLFRVGVPHPKAGAIFGQAVVMPLCHPCDKMRAERHARKATLEEACCAVCERCACASLHDVVAYDDDGRLHHMDGYGDLRDECRAADIRALMEGE